MASLVARPPGELVVGRHGLVGTPAGAQLRIPSQRQIVSVIARRDGTDSLRAVMKNEFNIDLSDDPSLTRGKSVSLLWCGHRQWFAIAEEGADLLATLRRHVGQSASLSDQSDSRFIVELSGPAVRAILAKLAPIDFHPRSFLAGATALTVVEHIGSQITRTEDDTYELMAFRSFADSFLHGILTAGAEFGIEVVATPMFRQ